jgi:hypothetical protein
VLGIPRVAAHPVASEIVLNSVWLFTEAVMIRTPCIDFLPTHNLQKPNKRLTKAQNPVTLLVKVSKDRPAFTFAHSKRLASIEHWFWSSKRLDWAVDGRKQCPISDAWRLLFKTTQSDATSFSIWDNYSSTFPTASSLPFMLAALNLGSLALRVSQLHIKRLNWRKRLSESSIIYGIWRN